MTLLEQLLAERFPTAAEVEAEQYTPIPTPPFRRGGSGLTRFEILLLQAKRAEAAA